jgi:hypothetical protein
MWNRLRIFPTGEAQRELSVGSDSSWKHAGAASNKMEAGSRFKSEGLNLLSSQKFAGSYAVAAMCRGDKRQNHRK